MASEIVTMAVKGHHFFTITRSLLELERFKDSLERLRRKLESRMWRASLDRRESLAALEAYRDRLVKQALARCQHLHPDFQGNAIKAVQDFRAATEGLLTQGTLPLASPNPFRSR